MNPGTAKRTATDNNKVALNGLLCHLMKNPMGFILIAIPLIYINSFHELAHALTPSCGPMDTAPELWNLRP